MSDELTVISIRNEAKRLAQIIGVKHALEQMTQSLLPDGCAIEVGSVEILQDLELFPEEAAAVTRASHIRQATFRAGRACARAALKRLGSPEVAIPRGVLCAPLWPRGFAGSITHTNEVAAAVVTRRSEAIGLGIDIETDEPLNDSAMLQIVCRPEELPGGPAAFDCASLRRGKLVFVLKEAAYKAFSPLTHTFLEFQDLGVSVDESARTFRAELSNATNCSSDQWTINGMFAEVEELFVAVAQAFRS